MAMLTPRAKWMAQTIAEVFGVYEYDDNLVKLFTAGASKSAFDAFFEGRGPARVFVYYQSQYKVNTETGEI